MLFYIKDIFLFIVKSFSEKSILFDVLCEVCIFLDKSDILVFVSYFYDFENLVFIELFFFGDFLLGDYSFLSWLLFFC